MGSEFQLVVGCMILEACTREDDEVQLDESDDEAVRNDTMMSYKAHVEACTEAEVARVADSLSDKSSAKKDL